MWEGKACFLCLIMVSVNLEKHSSFVADFDGQQYNIVQKRRNYYVKEKTPAWALLQNMRRV